MDNCTSFIALYLIFVIFVKEHVAAEGNRVCARTFILVLLGTRILSINNSVKVCVEAQSTNNSFAWMSLKKLVREFARSLRKEPNTW